MMEEWAANNIEFIREKVQNVMQENAWLKQCLDENERAKQCDLLRKKLEELKQEIAQATMLYTNVAPGHYGPIYWSSDGSKSATHTGLLLRSRSITGG